ncbi:unnamed protein product [Microthlaspi erraticum]|uniref:CTLH domain-containing protein n=1 Tax=Microthlaspi erraticum TaxID=1685480 RepID=A0A6D2KX10_9BRAS|nr:unnamed protein product [Microthlaspi erraticum]
MELYRAFEADENEKLPRDIESIDFFDPRTVISPDKLSVEFTGAANEDDHEAGMVQPQIPVPTKCDVYYFEVYVNNAGVRGQIAIGISTQRWGQEERLGELKLILGRDHVIWCSIHRACSSSSIFSRILPSYDSFKSLWKGYANFVYILCYSHNVIEPHNDHSFLHITFGSESSLRCCSYHGESGRIYSRKGEEKTETPTSDPYTTGDTVGCGINYVSQEFFFTENPKGLQRSSTVSNSIAPTFNLASETSVPRTEEQEEQEVSFALQARKNLREVIKSGQIDAALAIIQGINPKHPQNDGVDFLHLCQHMVQLVQKRAGDEDLEIGPDELQTFGQLCSSPFAKIYYQCYGMLRQRDITEEQIVQKMLGDSEKEIVADFLNEAVLFSNPDNSPFESRLEKILRQLRTCACYYFT